MKKIFSFIRKPWVIVILIILAAVTFFSLSSNSSTSNFETEIVSTRDLREVVSELGVVEAESNASLSFGASGVISEFFIEEGDSVEEGDILARLSAPALAFRVEEARARLAAEEARLSEMNAGLSTSERIVAEQTLRNAELSFGLLEESQELAQSEARAQVENARRALFSSNLTARLKEGGREDSNRTYAAPTITGTYAGEEEGVYEISLYPSHSQTGYSFRYSGLESGVGSVSTVEAQTLGDNGLYIIFPENFARNSNIRWAVEIPNANSATYVSLKNALESAELAERNVRNRSELALDEARASFELAQAQNNLRISGARSETIAAQIAGVTAARFALRQTEAAIEDTIIRAPFSGTVATNTIKAGERVNPGQEIINLIGRGTSKIVAYVSETDIARLAVGDSARIQFDAFRGEEFSGRVSFVSPAATVIQGVTRFKTALEITDTVDGLRNGLSADVDISTEEKLGVIAISSRAVIREGGKTFVRIKDDEYFREVPVTTGLRSSDGYTEITSGLEVGDEVITYISPQELTRLENLRAD